MTRRVDETHDPALRSWVESAQAEGTDFPIQNLPFGRFRPRGDARPGAWRLGVAIGDQVLDLRAALAAGLDVPECLAEPVLNTFMGLGRAAQRETRLALSRSLREGSPMQSALQAALHPQAGMELGIAPDVRGYSDFLTSRHHTERHGRFKGLKDPLPAAFMSLPVAYNGRTSSLRPSGQDVVRPNGQYRDAEGRIVFGPVVAMDFELELGAFVGAGNPLSEPFSIDEAPEHMFGYCLLNDWSAKDIQWWEQVLGPFLGKSFMTSLSPWIVTADALAPFAMPAPARAAGDPPLLPHLHGQEDQAQGGLDLALEAWLLTPRMREAGSSEGVRLSATHVKNLSWTFAQMFTHHASNGCPLLPGDLLGSGTISGEDAASMACMTEMTEAGKRPVRLPHGETRLWLHDGDEIVLKARASREGCAAIGFGECRGRIAPARQWPGSAGAKPG